MKRLHLVTQRNRELEMGSTFYKVVWRTDNKQLCRQFELTIIIQALDRLTFTVLIFLDLT